MSERTRIFVLLWLALLMVGGAVGPFRVQADPWPPAHPISLKSGFFTIAGEVKLVGGKQAVQEGVTVKLWKATSPDDMPLLKTTDSKGRFNFTVSATAGRLELLAIKQGLNWSGGDRAVGTEPATETRGGLAFIVKNPGIYDSFTLWMTGGTPTSTVAPSPTKTPEPIWPTNTPAVTATIDPGTWRPHKFTLVVLDPNGAPLPDVPVKVEYCNDEGTASATTSVDGTAVVYAPTCLGPYNPKIEPPEGWRCISISVDNPLAYEPVPTPEGGNQPCVQCFYLPNEAGTTTVVWVLTPGDAPPTATHTVTAAPSVTHTPSPTPTPRAEGLSVCISDLTDDAAKALKDVDVTIKSGGRSWTVATDRFGFADFPDATMTWPLEAWAALDQGVYLDKGWDTPGMTAVKLGPFGTRLEWLGSERWGVARLVVHRIEPTVTPVPSPDVWTVWLWTATVVVLDDGSVQIIDIDVKPSMLPGR